MIRTCLVMLILVNSIPGQSGYTARYDKTDTLDAADPFYSARPDTLVASRASAHRLGWNRQRVLGLAIMAVFGSLSLHYHGEADKAYIQYLRSGSYHDMDRWFAEAQQLDRYSGWSYAGFELGFLITVLSFDPRLTFWSAESADE